MAETDILNPVATPAYDNELGDSLSPSYGFTRKRTITKLDKKPAGGTPYTRDTQNTGHRFSLSWIDRNFKCVQRIKQFSEAFEDSFFTIVDWDGGPQDEGRHYVGRFVTEVVPIETDHGKWSILNAEFEEVPTVPMVEYPSDWDNEAVWAYAANGFGQMKTASMIAATGATWTVTPRPGLLDNPGALSPGASLDSTGAVGDWAQYEYHGYGFRLYMLGGPDGGQCNISLDGVTLDDPNALHPTNVFDTYSAAALGPVLVLEHAQAPLDFHRVMVTALNTKNAASTSTAIRWWALQVMR